MAIIKSGDHRHASSSPSGFNLQDLSVRAQLYLDDVRRQAREIVLAAQAEADQLRKQAEAEGRTAAEHNAQQRIEQQAQQLMQQQLQTALPALQQAVEAITQSRNAWILRWENQAIKLATAIAEKLIRGELTRQPEIPRRLVKEAMELAAGNPRLRLRLHPRDHANWGEMTNTLAARFESVAELQTISDNNVPQGSCILESEHGVIDQTWSAQLSRIEDELKPI